MICIIFSIVFLSACDNDNEKYIRENGVVIENVFDTATKSCVVKIAYGNIKIYDIERTKIVEYNTYDKEACSLDRGTELIVYVGSKNKAVGLELKPSL